MGVVDAFSEGVLSSEDLGLYLQEELPWRITTVRKGFGGNASHLDTEVGFPQ